MDAQEYDSAIHMMKVVPSYMPRHTFCSKIYLKLKMCIAGVSMGESM